MKVILRQRFVVSQCLTARLLACILALGVIAGQGADAADAPPPLEAFAALPKYQTVRLSPDGNHMATLEVIEGERRLVIYDVEDNRPVRRRVLTAELENERPGQPFDLHWANDTRLLLRYIRATMRDRIPIRETRMIAMNRDFSSQRMVPDLPTNRPPSPINRDLEETYQPPQYQDAIIHNLSRDSQSVLLQLRRFGQLSEAARGPGYIGSQEPEHSVYRLNVESGSISRVVKGDWSVRAYLADETGEVRLRTVLYESRGKIELRTGRSRNWRTLLGFDRKVGAPWSPIAFASDPNLLYVTARNPKGMLAVYDFDLRRGRIGKEVFGLPDYDIQGLLLSRSDRVIGVDYIADHPAVHYLAEPYRSLHDRLHTADPTNNHYIRSASERAGRFVVFSTDSADPGRYSLVEDGPAGMATTPIGVQYPGLEGQVLRPMERLSYSARDGLEIPAYLTRPDDGPGPWPLVVMVHGGPNVRDTQSFQFDVQFLASRGYAVLQPNFRGSSGYGLAFEQAGHGEWGLKMQNDLADGVAALTARGIASPGRACIAGWSYGGYAALMGAVRTPDLYRCVIAGAAITDLNKLMRERGRYLFETNNDPRLGNRWSDEQRMRDTSPASNADRIKVPVLLIHGSEDRVVSVEHSDLMANALAAEGVPHTYLRLEGGDHYRSRADHRALYLREMETLLARALRR